MALAATTWVTDYAAIIEDYHSSSSSGFAWLQAGDERGSPRACASREAVRCYSEARSGWYCCQPVGALPGYRGAALAWERDILKGDIY